VFKWVEAFTGAVLLLVGIAIVGVGFGVSQWLKNKIGAKQPEEEFGLEEWQAQKVVERKLFHRNMIVYEVMEARPVNKGRGGQGSKPTSLYVVKFVEELSHKLMFAVLDREKSLKLEFTERQEIANLSEFDKEIAKIRDFAVMDYLDEIQMNKVLDDMAKDKTIIEEIEETDASGKKVIKRRKTEAQVQKEEIQEKKEI